jgi:hypothetical protein
MHDPSSDPGDPYLEAADKFLALSKTAETPFMRAYYERVALRYLSSEGALKAAPGQRRGDSIATPGNRPQRMKSPAEAGPSPKAFNAR